MPDNMVYDQIRALLEEAMTMEHAAGAGYALLAESPGDTGAPDLMERLAEMEALHYRQLRKKYLLYGGHPDWTPTSTGREFLDQMGLEDKDQQAILALCQDMEKRHADYYSQRQHKVSDPTLKQFFRHLAEQEQQHAHDIQRLLN